MNLFFVFYLCYNVIIFSSDVIAMSDFDFLDKVKQGIVTSDFEFLRNLFVIRCHNPVNVEIVNDCFNMFLETNNGVVCFVFDKCDRLKRVLITERK